jgi:gamma-tubulin complex component 2
MLEDWVYKGQINDPYNEFMIVEDKDISKEKLKDEFNEKYPFVIKKNKNLIIF